MIGETCTCTGRGGLLLLPLLLFFGRYKVRVYGRVRVQTLITVCLPPFSSLNQLAPTVPSARHSDSLFNVLVSFNLNSTHSPSITASPMDSFFSSDIISFSSTSTSSSPSWFSEENSLVDQEHVPSAGDPTKGCIIV